MRKDDKYYPCNNCWAKRKYSFTKCPMADKQSCPVYLICDGLSMMRTNDSLINEIPVAAVVDILRHHGYSGELRKTEITTI